MTKKINLKDPIVDFSGQPLKEGEGDLTVGKALAMILNLRQNDKDPMRSYVLARTMYTEDTVDLNQSDLSYIEAAIVENQSYYPLVRGQLMLILLEKKEKTSVKEQE